jgi:hypothetical protein
MKRRHQHHHPCSSPDWAVAPAQGEMMPVLDVWLQDGQVLTGSPRYGGVQLPWLPKEDA